MPDIDIMIADRRAIENEFQNFKLTIALLINKLGGEVTITKDDHELAMHTHLESIEATKEQKEKGVLFHVKATHRPPDKEIN